MKCMYDSKFILSYNDNLLSDEERQKFEEHIKACDRCRSEISRDRELIGFLSQDVELNSTKDSRSTILKGIPLGMYRNGGMKYRLFSSAVKFVHGSGRLASTAVIIILITMVIANLQWISDVTRSAALYFNKFNNFNKFEELTDNGNSAPVLTRGRSYSENLTEKGSRNILFTGEDKNGLFNSIGILSINKELRKINVIVIPGEFYIDYSDKIRNELEFYEKANTDFYKFKNAHNAGRYLKYKGTFDSGETSFLADIIKEKFRITVDDYIIIKSASVERMADFFSGVDIDVPYENKDQPGFIKDFIEQIEQYVTSGNIQELNAFEENFGGDLQHSITSEDMDFYMEIVKDTEINEYEIECIEVSGSEKVIDGTSYIVFE